MEYINALYKIRAVPDILTLCKEALKIYPRDPEIRDLLEEGEEAYSEHAAEARPSLAAQGMSLDQYAWGMVATKSYPWTPPALRTRDVETIASANQILDSCSDCLEIRHSSLGSRNGTTQSFGMFAKRDIKKNEKILDSPSATGTSNKPATGQYCYNCAFTLKKNQVFTFTCCPTMKFCSEVCLEIANGNYHKALCGKDFSELYQAASSQTFSESSKARDNLVFLRLIAISLQAGTPPLMTPPIAWLGANYEAQSPIPWSRGANIIGPLRTLQILGVSIFAEDYDIWVLQTMWYVASHTPQENADVKSEKESCPKQL